MTTRRFTPTETIDNMRKLYGKTPEPVDDSPEDEVPPAGYDEELDWENIGGDK